MAIVRDRAQTSATTDQRFSTPNRNNAGSPIGSLTPLYPNELVLDTTNRVLWKAIGLANTDWVTVHQHTR